MSQTKRVRIRQMTGFTLVEVLVAFTLLSAVMLGLGAALRTIAQSEQRVDRRLAEADQVRVAIGFIRAVLGRISAPRVQSPGKAGDSVYLFSSTSRSVEWIGVMPAGYGPGGRHYFRLAEESSGDTQGLVIRYAPWNGSAAFPDWSRVESRVLLAPVANLHMEYCHEAVGSTCMPHWTVADRLPGRIRITWSDSRGTWPPLVIPMRLIGRGDGGRGGFSLGPE